MVRFSDIVWNPTDEKVIKNFWCKRRCKKLPSKMFISCPFVICVGDLSSNWFSTDSWSCVPWNFFNWRFFFLVLSAGISFLGCCALLNTYLFSVLKLLLSELGRSSSVDCLIVGINYFDTGLELDCVLAWFGRNVDEMRVFFFMGKISFVFGCDWSRYVSVEAEVEWVLYLPGGAFMVFE